MDDKILIKGSKTPMKRKIEEDVSQQVIKS